MTWSNMHANDTINPAEMTHINNNVVVPVCDTVWVLQSFVMFRKDEVATIIPGGPDHSLTGAIDRVESVNAKAGKKDTEKEDADGGVENHIESESGTENCKERNGGVREVVAKKSEMGHKKGKKKDEEDSGETPLLRNESLLVSAGCFWVYILSLATTRHAIPNVLRPLSPGRCTCMPLCKRGTLEKITPTAVSSVDCVSFLRATCRSSSCLSCVR